MTDDLLDYLADKGTIELLCVVDTAGMRFVDILEEVPITSTTLSKRLDRAERLGLVEQGVAVDPQFRKQHYFLTERGWRLKKKADEYGLPGLYRALRNLQNEYDGAVEAFMEEMTEEADTIMEYPSSVGKIDENAGE